MGDDTSGGQLGAFRQTARVGKMRQEAPPGANPRFDVRIEFERFKSASASLSSQPRYVAELSRLDEEQVWALLPKEFYSFRSSPTLTGALTQCGYDLVVDDGVARHQLLLVEDDVPESLWPLLRWLEKRALANVS